MGTKVRVATYVGVWLLVGVAGLSLAGSRERLSEAEQLSAVGGGPGYNCYGVSTCTKCVSSAGCTYWSYGPGGIMWGCTCTSYGSEGCTTAATWKYCSSLSGSSCNQTGGTKVCGVPQKPDAMLAAKVGAVWVCTPKCMNGGSYSAQYCTNCL